MIKKSKGHILHWEEVDYLIENPFFLSKTLNDNIISVKFHLNVVKESVFNQSLDEKEEILQKALIIIKKIREIKDEINLETKEFMKNEQICIDYSMLASAFISLKIGLKKSRKKLIN